MERFEADIVLRDGSYAHVRPVHSDDRAHLMDFVSRLSVESASLRFFSPVGDPERVVERMLPGQGRFGLVATREGKIVAHAAYYAISRERAESAVVVADAYQGKGLGSILLGQLAEAASKAGVSVFEAVVVPENYRMLEVHRDLGLPIAQKIEPGQIRITYPTSVTPEAIELFERREAIAASAAMESFLRPSSVAVIGASREHGTIGGELFRNLLEGGFRGPVYPVNPKAEVVQSVRAYRSVLDCPGPVDLAVVVVPARAVLAVVGECAKKGVRAVVVISAGFAELGEEGARLQQDLVRVCRDAGMRLIGPNCLGIVNTDPEVSLNAQFSIFKPPRGRIGFLSQSGALGIAIIDQMSRLGLGMSSFVSVGNKADISGNDLIQFWESDKATDLILLYLESFGNPRKFSRLARRVARKKPIIAVKSGRSSAGFRATQSHTGALVAASDVTVDALFQQSGVIRTDTLEEMFDVAALLSTQSIPKGERVAIITNAGGAGILAADACEALGLKVPELSAETQAALRDFLHEGAGVRNPVDMIASAAPEDYARSIGAVSNDPGVDAVLVIFVPPIAVRPETVAAVILEAVRGLKGRVPVATTFMASHGIPMLLSDGQTRVPSYPFPEAAAKALAKAVQYGRWLAVPEGSTKTFPGVRNDEAAAIVARALSSGSRWLSPEETESLLSCYGIPLVTTIRAGTPSEAGMAAGKLGGKVVLKGVAPGLVHKTEVGAVNLGLSGEKEVSAAASRMKERLSREGYSVSEFLVQPMVSAGVEMFVGVAHDPIFGPVVACGAGGALVELLRDVAVRITPLTERDASDMVQSLKTLPLLKGYRGGPRHDLAALEELVLRVGNLVEEIPEVAELDLNPAIVLQEGRGVSVVDARVRVAESVPPLPLGARRR